jgi:hypothetical protein
MEKKCSYQAIQQYKSEINKYLKDKGISDFSKYKVYIKDDKLFFDKWEYDGIENPDNITIQNIQDISKYQEIYQRILYFDLSIRPIPQHITINARSMLGSDNINNEQIIGITGMDIEISNFGCVVERNQILSSKFRLHHGLLKANSEINKTDITIKDFNGRIRILIFYINS